MTIERSEGVDRLRTWGCGLLLAVAVAGAVAAAFWSREGTAAKDLEGRIEALERRVEALERR